MSLVDRTDIDNYKFLLADYLVKNHHIDLKRPFTCLNPDHEDRHPSMSFTNKYNICKCFSCGVSYDLFDLIKIDYGAESFKEQLEIVSRIYPNIKMDISKQFSKIESDDKVSDFSNYFKKCENNIDKTDYLNTRHIEPNLIQKYKIGYDDRRNIIVFPINKNCYYGRGTMQDLKFKSSGKSYLWNEDLLRNSENNLIYVTEGVFDSLSLETIDPNVKTISLNGVTNYMRLLEVIKENNYNGYLVLAFDHDRKGLLYQEIIKKELAKLNVSSFSITLISSFADEKCKDLNEALITKREQLEKSYEYFNENFKKIIMQKSFEKGSELEL